MMQCSTPQINILSTALTLMTSYINNEWPLILLSVIYFQYNMKMETKLMKKTLLFDCFVTNNIYYCVFIIGASTFQ